MNENAEAKKNEAKEALNISSTENVDGGVEFIFGDPEEDAVGLIFEDETDEPDLSEDAVEIETTQKESASQVRLEEYREEKTVEFFVPDSFTVDEQYSSSDSEGADAPRIVTTYVPGFTGVADTYRMKDDPRPRTVEEKEVRGEKSLHDAGTEDVDPTAELEEDMEIPEPVSVNVKPLHIDEDVDSTSTVFKFMNETTEQPSDNSESAEAVDTDEQENLDEARFEPIADEAPNYSIPDPVERLSEDVVDYRPVKAALVRRELVDAPVDINDRVECAKYNKASEYTAYSQRDSFKDKFLDSIMSIKVRFFASCAITLVLLIIENMFAFGFNVPEIFGFETLPGAMALLDLQFVVCLYLLAIPESIRAIKQLIRGRATPELMLTLALAVDGVYSIIMVVNSPREYAVFGLLFAVLALSAIAASYFRTTSDFLSYKAISTNGEKQIIDNKFTRTLVKENAALDGLIEEHKSRSARFFSTVFVSDFFVRSDKNSENSANVLLTLGASLGAALVTGIVAFFIPGGIVSAISSFALVFMLATPAVAMITHKLPYLHANRAAAREECAIIGECSLCEYSGIDVITFDDTEVFGPEDVNLQRILLYGRNDNLSKALSQMSALFMNVGGPLDYLFSNALDRKCPPAEDICISDGGVSGVIDGHRIMGGTIEYMRQNGARIPEETGSAPGSESTRIIYAAEDGTVYAKFYIKYSFSEEFSMLLPTLYDEKITPLIYTRDPNITPEFIMMLTAGNDKIRILRKYNSSVEDRTVYRSISAGIVSFGEKMNAINTILVAKKYKRFSQRLAKIEILTMLFGVMLSSVLSLSGSWLVPPLFLAGYQALICGAVHFISKKTFARIL